MKKLIISGAVILTVLLVSVSCTKAPPSLQTPAPVPPPGINIPPPTGTPTPLPTPAPTPTPSPAPALTLAPPRGPIYTDSGDTITTSVGDGFAIGLHVVLRLGARWQVSYDEANVSVRATQTALRIRVEDRGKGFHLSTLTAAASTGLLEMRERALMLGGKLNLRSTLGIGTLIMVEIPLASDKKGSDTKKRATCVNLEKNF